MDDIYEHIYNTINKETTFSIISDDTNHHHLITRVNMFLKMIYHWEYVPPNSWFLLCKNRIVDDYVEFDEEDYWDGYE